MKNAAITSLALIATLATAAAHPGHDHSSMGSQEFAWHHLLTGGFVTVALASVAWMARAAVVRRRRQPATELRQPPSR